ncbi:MAG: phosphatase PAP2 family protein [bacterium]
MEASTLVRSRSKALLSVYAVIGFGLAIGCAWLFTLLADEVPEQGWMAHLDAAVMSWLELHSTEGGESIFVAVSLLGEQLLWPVLVAAGIVLARRRDWRRFALFAVASGGGALLNVALKLSFQRARPMFATEFSLRSWSFPSGHAMVSLICYGLLAWWLASEHPSQKHWIYGAAALLVVAIGFARVYLGVHYVSDVFAGYCAGFVWLTVCITGYRVASNRSPLP